MAHHTPVRTEFDVRGLSIIILSSATNLLWGGIFKSLGVLLPVLEEQFISRTWLIGIIISGFSLSSDIAGMFANLLEKRLRTRPLLIICAMLEAVGLLLVPFSPDLVVFFCSLVLMAGTGCGLLSVLNKVLIARHFTRHFTLACGIGHAGNVLAYGFAPMIQLFNDTYGWRGATLLLGAICAHIVTFAVAVREDKSQYRCVPRQEQEDHQPSNVSAPAVHLCTRLYKAVDLDIIMQFKFWVICSCRFAQVFSFNVWMIYYVSHLLVKGFSPEAAANLCLAVAVGYFFGTVIWAPLTDRGVVKCSTGIVASTLLLTLTFCIDPWSNSALGVVANTFFFGLASASLTTLNDTLVRDVFKVERLANAYGYSRALTFLPRLLAGFLPGYIYEETGSYDTAFIVLGLSFLLGLIPLVIGVARNKMSNPDDV